MSFKWQKSGPNHVPAYQMSGIPYVTSSGVAECPDLAGSDGHPVEISFPFVTKTVKIRNIGASILRVAFSYTGSQTPGQGAKSTTLTRNYFLISPPDDDGNAGSDNSIIDFDVRCTKMYFAGDGGTTGFSLFAGLTTIPATQFPVLTGSINGAVAFEGIG